VTKRPAKIGICPLGYGDGLPRAAEGFSVRLMHRGIPFSVPIVGHICMDYVTVDLTDTPAALGDTVIFWDDPRPLATHVGTIPYEILTAISPRVERKKKGDPT
jgi:alanine racemase